MSRSEDVAELAFYLPARQCVRRRRCHGKPCLAAEESRYSRAVLSLPDPQGILVSNPLIDAPRQRGLFARFNLRPVIGRMKGRVPWPENTHLVNLERKFIYCPIQKIACSSLMRWFLWTQGVEDSRIDDPHELVSDYQLQKLPARQAFDVLRDPSFFRFAFVRHPWARLVSAYLNLVSSRNPVSEPVLQHVHGWRGARMEIGPGNYTDITFREFLEFLTCGRPRGFNVHWKPQYLFFEASRFDFVGRFERLPEDFEIIRQRLGIEQTLPHSNSTNYDQPALDTGVLVADVPALQLKALPAQPAWHQFYPPDLRDLVARLYARDIRQFGYRFES